MSESTSLPGSGRAQGAGDEPPPFRYGARMAGEIEARWQDRWEADGTFNAPNPACRSPQALTGWQATPSS